MASQLSPISLSLFLFASILCVCVCVCCIFVCIHIVCVCVCAVFLFASILCVYVCCISVCIHIVCVCVLYFCLHPYCVYMCAVFLFASIVCVYVCMFYTRYCFLDPGVSATPFCRPCASWWMSLGSAAPRCSVTLPPHPPLNAATRLTTATSTGSPPAPELLKPGPVITAHSSANSAVSVFV